MTVHAKKMWVESFEIHIQEFLNANGFDNEGLSFAELSALEIALANMSAKVAKLKGGLE